jgi:hypothetical protein
VIDVAHDDWAKMDARLDSNPKIRDAGRNGREVFLFLLRRNRLLAGGGADGRIPVSNIRPRYLADQLMMSEADARDGVEKAVEAKLISLDEEFVSICGFDEDWGGRAPLSDAERARRYRERHGASRDDRDASRDGRDESDASRRREEKRVEEKRVESAPRARSTKTLLPADWAPKPAHAALAAQVGVDMPTEAIKFADHATANGKKFIDWDAAFRTWLRNAAEFQRNRGGGYPANGNGAVVPLRPRKILNSDGGS